jgi:hypothetical protein
MLSHEHEQRRRLEDMVEQLAKQHSHLEQAAQQQARATPSGLSAGSGQLLAHSIHSEEDDENEFYDAEEDEIQTDYIVQVPIGHRRTPSGVSTNSQVIFLLSYLFMCLYLLNYLILIIFRLLKGGMLARIHKTRKVMQRTTRQLV